MDFNKLSMGAKLALIGGAVLIVDLFLPWYGVFGISLNAFDAEILAWGGCIVAIAGAAVLLLKAMGKKEMSAGQFKPEQLAFILGAVGFVMIVLRWLTENEFVKFGLYIGILASGVVAYGAFSEMKSKGMKIPGMK
jgi:hypothetical protein